MADRFRGFLPVIIDVETGGFNCRTDALLEIGAVIVGFDIDGELSRRETIRHHVKPFAGANIERASLAVNGIDPDHPLRPAIDERDALGRAAYDAEVTADIFCQIVNRFRPVFEATLPEH